MRSNTDAFNTNAKSKFSIDVTTYDLNGFMDCVCLSIDLKALST